MGSVVWALLSLWPVVELEMGVLSSVKGAGSICGGWMESLCTSCIGASFITVGLRFISLCCRCCMSALFCCWRVLRDCSIWLIWRWLCDICCVMLWYCCCRNELGWWSWCSCCCILLFWWEEWLMIGFVMELWMDIASCASWWFIWGWICSGGTCRNVSSRAYWFCGDNAEDAWIVDGGSGVLRRSKLSYDDGGVISGIYIPGLITPLGSARFGYCICWICCWICCCIWWICSGDRPACLLDFLVAWGLFGATEVSLIVVGAPVYPWLLFVVSILWFTWVGPLFVADSTKLLGETEEVLKVGLYEVVNGFVRRCW